MSTTLTELTFELMALTDDQREHLLLMLAGSDPDAVRHALDVERQTRPGDRYVTVDFADIETVVGP